MRDRETALSSINDTVRDRHKEIDTKKVSQRHRCKERQAEAERGKRETQRQTQREKER